MAEPVSFRVSCRIEWKIKNIFSVPEQESEEFAFNGSFWKLFLAKVRLGEVVLSIVLKETIRQSSFRDFTSRVFIVDENHAPQFLSEKVCEERSEQYFHSCIWRMEESVLQQKGDTLLVDDTVTFVCAFLPETTSEAEGRGHKPVETSMNAEAGGTLGTLVFDFRRFLNDNAWSDVTLKCGDSTIPAHSLVLSERSEVFAAMFRNDLAESRSGVIEVTDMDPAILELFLQFIYSCKLPDMSMNAAPQLYEAADKYGVESLKKDCSAFMKENLSEGNACCILVLADSHSDSDLKDCVVSFIVKKKLFLKDDIWIKFCKDHPMLAVEVLNHACKTLVSWLV